MILKKTLVILAIGLQMMGVEGCVTAERCAERFPGSTNVITTIIDTTIITSSRSFDTIVYVTNMDTIFILDKKTDVQVRIVKLPGDSIWVEPICPADTITIEKVRTETTFERIQNLAKKQEVYWTLGFIILGIFALGYLLQSIKK
jgi:hypothetical protein